MRSSRLLRLLLMVPLVCATVILSGVLPSAAAGSMATSGAGKPRDHTPHFRDGYVLVGFDKGVSKKSERTTESAVGAHEVATLGEGAHLLSVPAGQVIPIVTLLQKVPGVRYAEPDYLSELAATPNDPNVAIQWAYQNTGQTVNGAAGTAGDDEHAAAAWNVTTGSQNIVIGEVDTGVDYTHPDLAANIWTNPGGIGGCAAGSHGYNVLTGVCDPMDDDTQYGGHGTHVAGIMGAVGNNGVGVTGVNWTTTILPVKWVDATGNGATSNLIAALDWLISAKQAGANVRIVNDSDVFYGTAYSQALSDEIDKLGQNNILFVTAAGNTSDNNDNPAVRRYPCGYERPTELCVMGSDQNDARPSWANYGPTTVDLAAPGNNIYSTLRGGAYGFISGSSMSSPQVAGTAALILGVQDMTAQQLKADILEHVDVLPSMSGVSRTGGRLDVCAALPGCATTPPTTATLGLSTVGANSDQFSADLKRVNAYQLTTGASVSKLSMYLQPTGISGQQVIEGILYADTNGAPGALIAVSNPLTFASTNSAGWYDLPFSSAVTLSPGHYWIGVITGATGNVAGFRYNSVSGARDYNSNTYTSGPSNPFGSFSTNSEQMSLYATYTVVPAGPAPFSVTPPEVTETGQGGYFAPQAGQPLGTDNGVWDFSPTGYAYQWSRCDATGANCTPITGATSSSYTPASGDGGTTLRINVTATNANGSTTASSPPTQIVQAPPPPSTFGKTTVGASTDPGDANYERVDSFAVSQAVSVTKLTIYLKRYISGQQVLEGVLYADSNGAPGALVAATAPVTFGTTATTGWYDLPFASPVSIGAGTYWIGLLTGQTGDVFALAYDTGPANSGAVTAATYANGPLNPFGAARLQTEQISVYATYTTGAASAAPTNSTPPAITGTAQVGQTLSATTGTWNNNPTGYAYQWSDCSSAGASCAAITGASNASYTVATSDVGSTLEVAVTATNAAGPGTASSAPTSVVQQAAPLAPTNTSPPTVSGTAQVGQTLSATTGTWSNGPTAYAYQWSRCNTSGASCAAITGASNASYTAATSDVGSTLEVSVTATNAVGPGTASSAPTAVVQAAPSGGTFGLTSVGTNSDWMSANRKRVNHYTISTGASVSKLTMYLQPAGTSGQQLIKPVIYADQNGAPGALVALGNALTFASTNTAGWYDLPFASPVALSAGTYWIGVISGNTSGVTGFRFNSVSGARAYNTNSYSSGPSNPFGSATLDSEQMSLYASYQ